MNSEVLGKDISTVEVTHISAFGFWLLAQEQEMFLSFDDFPWFRNAPVGKILNIEEIFFNHFYWADLDIDLTVEIIQDPECFPLIASLD